MEIILESEERYSMIFEYYDYENLSPIITIVSLDKSLNYYHNVTSFRNTEILQICKTRKNRYIKIFNKYLSNYLLGKNGTVMWDEHT